MKFLKKTASVLCGLYFVLLLPAVWFYLKADFGEGVTRMFSFVLLALLCALPASGFSVRRARWFLLAISLIQIPPAFLYGIGFVHGLSWNGTYYRFDPMIGLWFHGAVLLVGLILMLVGLYLSRRPEDKIHASVDQTPLAARME